MSNLVRELIAFDILKQELEDIEVQIDEVDILEDEHLALLKQCSGTSKRIIASIANMSEFDFAKSIENVEFVYKVGSKQLLNIHSKLLAWTIDFFIANDKANAITEVDFSDQAEVRLDLWQTKSAKAKNQIKTLANALGKQGYLEFIKHYRLQHTELSWPL